MVSRMSRKSSAVSIPRQDHTFQLCTAITAVKCNVSDRRSLNESARFDQRCGPQHNQSMPHEGRNKGKTGVGDVSSVPHGAPGSSVGDAIST